MKISKYKSKWSQFENIFRFFVVKICSIFHFLLLLLGNLFFSENILNEKIIQIEEKVVQMSV